ncbi:hypothetical protein S83_043606, partial [Arachis hypogaea]
MSELGGGNCFSRPLLGVNVGLALVEGIVAFVALFQVLLLFLSCFNLRQHCFSDMKLVRAFDHFRVDLVYPHQMTYNITTFDLGYDMPTMAASLSSLLLPL